MICLTLDLLDFILSVMEGKRTAYLLITYYVPGTVLDTLFPSLIWKYHFLESLH